MSQTGEFISDVMDFMGYSSKMVEYRREMYRKMDNLTNINNRRGPCTRFTTGGKAEGNARYFESDIDHMYILKDVVCTDVPQYFETNRQITLFKVENTETPPGYVRLKLLQQNGQCLREEISASLFENSNGDKYLSSTKFTDNIKESTIWLPGFTTQAKTGPSSPVSNGYLSIDRVVSLSCFLPSETRNIIAKSKLDPRCGRNRERDIHGFHSVVYAVPVGDRLSLNKYLEWRVCYTKVELYLIQELSVKQLKIYILLKLISRSKLKPLCNELTSYLMKNVILWICVQSSLHFCTKENIFSILQCCLNFLRSCFISNYLPCYTNSKRNLLQGRVNFHERVNVIYSLSEMLKLGPNIIFCCGKVKIAVLALQKIPRIFRVYSEYRDEIEKMLMILCECRARLRTPGVTQESYDGLLLQDNTYMETKTKLLTSIGLLAPSVKVKRRDLQELVDKTKPDYYDRLYRMLS